MEQILEQLTVSQKRNIIKNNETLSETFKKTNKNLSKAKLEDIDNFINDLSDEEKKIILDMATSELGIDEKSKSKKKTKKDFVLGENDNIPEENLNELTNTNNEMVTTNTTSTEVPPSLTESAEPVDSAEKEEKEIPEELTKKMFRDLYPTNMHKTKYVNENPSLKMAALTKGILSKNTKKEDIDDFLVKQVPKNPKLIKQLGVDWLENKKSLKIDTDKLSSIDSIRDLSKEIALEDIETYAYLVQEDISESVFTNIEFIKKEEEKAKAENSTVDSVQVKELEDKIKDLENKLSSLENKHKDEVNNIRQNYEIEKEKQRTKNEQKIETAKSKFDEEKAQLVKIQADSDRRFSDERKTYQEQIDNLSKENKKFQERINAIGTDLVSQNKQHKDASKSLNRIQNRIEELQVENKELTTKNDELKTNYESATEDLNRLRKQEVLLQNQLQELTLKLQELEKTKIAFLLSSSEIQGIIKELNAIDETKERIVQLLNIETRYELEEEEQELTLDDLWVKLMDQESDIIADYLSVGTEEILDPDVLKDKIDSLLDLEQNIKAREVLVKVLYEKGYKAYKSLNK
ncbi:MAG: hypothetical protein U0354_12360 [Candidatus Sericytochromatia bacterium]